MFIELSIAIKKPETWQQARRLATPQAVVLTGGFVSGSHDLGCPVHRLLRQTPTASGFETYIDTNTSFTETGNLTYGGTGLGIVVCPGATYVNANIPLVDTLHYNRIRCMEVDAL